MTASIIGLSGFGLSVFFMWWAMIVLVRFYIFDNILYTIFMFSMLVTGENGRNLCWTFSNHHLLHTGIIFNVTSLNILLTEFREPIDFLPFIIGSPLTIFWTVFGLATSIIKKDFLPALAYIPMAEYDASFYDGLGYDPEVTKVHPFTKMFMNQSSIFLNTNLILVILFVMIGEERIFKLKVHHLSSNLNPSFSHWNNLLDLRNNILRTINEIHLVDAIANTQKFKRAIKLNFII